MGSDLQHFFIEHGIEHQKTVPHNPQQNGHAEHFNCTILEKAEAMRHHACLPPTFWQDAVETALHIYNRQPMRRLQWKPPITLWNGKKPDVSYFRVFGTQAYVFIPKDIRDNKLSPKSEAMTFIGYEQGTKGYRFWSPKRQKVVISSTATFDESIFPHCPDDRSDKLPTRNNVQQLDDLEDTSDEDDDLPPQQDEQAEQPKGNRPVPQQPPRIPTLEPQQPPEPQRGNQPPLDPPRQQRPPRPAVPPRAPCPPPPPNRNHPRGEFDYRRSTRVRQPVVRPDSVYGVKSPVEIENAIRNERDFIRNIMEQGRGGVPPPPQPRPPTPDVQMQEEPYPYELPLPDANIDDDDPTVNFSNAFMTRIMAHAFGAKDVPTHYKDINKLSADEQAEWRKATDEEISSLQERNVWELVDLPKG